MGTKDADKVRAFVYENYIKPAKGRRCSSVSFKAKEIHERMGFIKNNYTNICGALCRSKMMNLYGLKKILRDPPSDGPNVIITYEL